MQLIPWKRNRAYRYYLGLTSGDGRRRYEARASARRIAIFLERTEISPGCTVNGGLGWFLGQGERCLTVYVSGISQRDHRRILRWMLTAFRQRAIGYEPAGRLRFFAKAA